MKNKKVLIIILMIILLILITLTGTALAYIKTDLFKTNKQLFFKYVSQIGEITNNLGDEELVNYFEKQKVKPYESTGKLTAKVSLPEYEEQLKSTNNVNIIFNGKNDIPNKRQDYKINLNYSDTVTFPVEYRRDEDLYALTSNIIVNKFVAVENDNLKEFFTKCGVKNVSNIPDKIEKTETTLKDDEIESLLETYKTILQENLKEENFSKLDNNTIVLTLKKYELKNILIEFLEELKNLDRIDNKKNVEQLIKIYQNTDDSQDEALKITVYKSSGKLTKIEVKIEEVTISIGIENSKILIDMNIPEEPNISILIEKTKQQNVLEYQITFFSNGDNGLSQVYLKTEFLDIASEDVKEKYVIGIKGSNTEYQNQELLYEYTFDVEKTFRDSIDIEGITNENSVVLNTWNEEQIQNLLEGIENRISQVNEQQMQALGVEQNPLIMITPIGYAYNNRLSSITKNTYQNNQQYNEAMQSEQQQMQALEKKASNLEFEQYAGEKVTGSVVKTLLTKIQTKVVSSDNNIKSILYNNNEVEVTTTNISQMQRQIRTAGYYQVSFEYNKETNLIEKVVIKQSN